MQCVPKVINQLYIIVCKFNANIRSNVTNIAYNNVLPTRFGFRIQFANEMEKENNITIVQL